jgi:beta-glucosidase
VAIVVVGRTAGEDLDLPLEPGGYYLSNDERTLLDAVTSAFARTVVVLNVGNAIDLSWLDAYGERVSAVLLAWQGGMEAGNAAADVLYGDVNPSGRLACTIARRYEDYPSSGSFGNRAFNNYEEDIFVGYRWFETFSPEKILYPFGF